MGLHYLLAFMGGNLENRRKLMPIRMINSVNLHNKTIENIVRIFKDDDVIDNKYKAYY